MLWHDLKALCDVEALRGFDLNALQGAPDCGPKQRARLAAIGAELARERLSVSRIDPTMPRDRLLQVGACAMAPPSLLRAAGEDRVPPGWLHPLPARLAAD